MNKKAFALTLLGFFFFFTSKANNLSLSALTFTDPNVTFTITWDNSWYANAVPNNWDAVWLFVKYKDCTTTDWQHASLSAVPGDHSVGDAVNYELETVSDNKGIFIKRKIAGTSGSVNTTVTLKLNIPAGTYNFKVFGIEMVKVLNENFDVGDGAAANRFNSVNIASEAAITAAVLGGTGTVDLPAAYPKGWNAFYCMKYEITQGQYVDFLNTLTYDQQANRVATSPDIMATNWAMGPNAATVGRSRNGVKVKTSGIASTTPAEYACDLGTNAADGVPNNIYNENYDGQNLPCNYISWADLVAYLDWACLRPMTDLEFEKICRGPIGRVAGEYVWGNISLLQATTQHSLTSACGGCGNKINNRNGANETSTSSGNGLCAYGYNTDPCRGAISTCDEITVGACNTKGGGPIRVGFAATATTDRSKAGATYYGAMDMSGNLMERIVATNAAGSTFTGTLGDGTLDANGHANCTTIDGGTWPSYSTASGSGSRGGDYYNVSTYLQTSNRSLATTTNTARACNYGGRGVR